jgi:hypothetical protein
MADIRVRREIARRAARLMYAREESEYFTAKRKAAAEMGVDYRYRPKDLPSNAEIREQIEVLADLYEGEKRLERLNAMRLDALRLMRKLERFRPHLIGSVLTGHIRTGSDIDIHVFTDSIPALTDTLDAEGLTYTTQNKRIIKHNEERIFTHIHVEDRHTYELTVYSADKVNYPFKSSITGKTIERASTPELEAMLRQSLPGVDLDAEVERLEDYADPYELFRLLLIPLERVKQSPQWHPEGDALYHSLQVFELARAERPWDEEFLQAALLHDVGKAIDPRDHVAAGLAALEGAITERTAFLIAHHMDAHARKQGELGARAARRLSESEDYEDLLLISELDRKGRRRGAAVCTVDEAIDYLRSLSQEDEDARDAP